MKLTNTRRHVGESKIVDLEKLVPLIAAWSGTSKDAGQPEIVVV